MLLGLTLDTASTTPHYITLIDKLREKILKGELKYGDKLPSSRTLAQDLGIARNTVISV